MFDQFGRIEFRNIPSEAINGLYTYHLYLRLRAAPPDNILYDLVRYPQDVCIQLVPESVNLGTGRPTNTVRLSREQLSRALKSFPL